MKAYPYAKEHNFGPYGLSFADDRWELRDAIVGAQGLVIRSATTVTEEVLAAATDLLVIGRAGIGLDNIDVATCGRISPLKALNYLIHSFESDIVILDYRVRGFTRDVNGKKHYIDHNINSIQNFLARDTREHYQMVDVNVYQENIFHTKMMLKEFDLDSYLFDLDVEDISPKEQRTITEKIRREMLEIFYGQNITRGMTLS